MLLTLSTTYQPATDLGYLLHKNPFRAQAFQVSFGKVYVFYPEARETQCSASLLVDLDLTGLIQERRIFPRDRYISSPYLTDLPFCASAFLSSAIAQVLGTAMIGQSRERPELAKMPIPLKAEIMLLVSKEESRFAQIFEPLGYTVSVQKNLNQPASIPLYSYYTLILEKECLLSELLSHLYVLLPIFDLEKHFWFRDYELDRFLQRGEGWLEKHPHYKSIVKSYERQPGSPLERAVTRILGDTLQEEKETFNPFASAQESPLLEKLTQILKELRAKKIVDLRCREGHLLKRLSVEPTFEEIVGMDISSEMLEKSRVYLHLEEEQQGSKVRLIHGSLIYHDKYLQDFDTVVLVSALPYHEKEKRSRLEKILFEYTHPEHLVFAHSVFRKMSPNENASDWTQEQFQQWGQEITKQFPYTVTFSSLENSAPQTQQIAVFSKKQA